ncbi:MAG: acyl-CoA dehydrogenase [Planctomycetes bacterium]|nr:acyl-CoA dehydrogenase [Planctomycetota bacterium]
MDFELSDELRMVRDTARKVCAERIAPRAAEVDREGIFPAEGFRALAEAGFAGILIPEAYGGSDLGQLAYVLVMEEVNRACASTGVTYTVHCSLTSSVLAREASEAQRRRWLPSMATGRLLGAYCLSEPGSGSDAAALRTTCRREGDEWVLDGSKAWVSNGGHADLYLVYASRDPGLRSRGICAFVVEKDAPGLTVGKFERKMGIRGSSTTMLHLEGCRVPAANLLGEEGEGFRIAMRALDGGRIGIAAQALGIARGCLEDSVRYASRREQFGHPIAEFQAIQWKLADMAMELDAARLLTWRAAWLADRGERHTREASMAKLHASEMANRAATQAVQIHGGVGYTRDFPVERYFRDAKVTEIYEGTSQVQRLVIARELLKAT